MSMAPAITVYLSFRDFVFTSVPDSPPDLVPGLSCISIPSTMLELFPFYSLSPASLSFYQRSNTIVFVALTHVD